MAGTTLPLQRGVHSRCPNDRACLFHDRGSHRAKMSSLHVNMHHTSYIAYRRIVLLLFTIYYTTTIAVLLLY